MRVTHAFRIGLEMLCGNLAPRFIRVQKDIAHGLEYRKVSLQKLRNKSGETDGEN